MHTNQILINLLTDSDCSRFSDIVVYFIKLRFVSFLNKLMMMMNDDEFL